MFKKSKYKPGSTIMLLINGKKYNAFINEKGEAVVMSEVGNHIQVDHPNISNK